VQELADPEEKICAARERDGAPRLEGALRGLDGAVDLFDAREVDLAGLHAQRRVVDRPAPARLALDPLPVDPVRDPRNLAGSLLRELIRYFGHPDLLA